MSLLFRHLALLFVAVTFANAVIAVRRVPQFFTDSTDRSDATRFVWHVAAWLAGLFLLLEILTVTAQVASPLCFLPLRGLAGSWLYVAWGLWAGWIAGVTLWVVLGPGAARLARFGPLFARVPTPGHTYAPRTIRVVTLAWCAGSLVIPLVLPSTEPMPLSCSAVETSGPAI